MNPFTNAITTMTTSTLPIGASSPFVATSPTPHAPTPNRAMPSSICVIRKNVDAASTGSSGRPKRSNRAVISRRLAVTGSMTALMSDRPFRGRDRPGVVTGGADELVVTAALDDAPRFEDDDAIDVPHGREPVRD